MKRNHRKSKPRSNRKRATNRAKPAENAGETKTDATRRQFLDFARGWGLVAVVGGGGAWYLIDDFVATAQELDLS